MKQKLRLMALGFLLAGVGFWLAGGANRGWTKTSVPIMKKDEVTGIEYPAGDEKKFIPGVDFLGAAVAAAGILAAASLLFRGKKTENQQPTQI